MIELYHNDMSSCAQKVRGQLAEKGIDWTSHELDLRSGGARTPEFLTLNPKGVVPVIVHNGTVVAESNIIMEYIEDAFPERPLMPQDAPGRARVREWLQRLDTGLHFDLAVVSLGVAFRNQLLAVHKTQAALDAHYASISLPGLADICREVVPQGVAAPAFVKALSAWVKAFVEMEAALEQHDYLVGDALSIADLAYLPYICRFEQLGLERIWATLPRVTNWLGRMKATQAYRKGLEAWLNPGYIAVMKQSGDAVSESTAPVIDRLVAEARR
jgi:glutathione S-transferase